MRLLFITTGALPIPSVKGGAVENLVEMFIKDNERLGKHQIVLYSISDEKAKVSSLKYNFCEFRYITIQSKIDYIKKIIRYSINRLPKVYLGNLFISKVISDIRKRSDDYDAIIIENSPEYAMVLGKQMKEKLILHLHNDSLNRETKLHNKIIKNYNAVYTISDFVRQQVSLISNKENVFTLYNGIDLNKFNKNMIQKKKKRDKYNIKEDYITIVYSGRLVPEKGVKELVEAFLKLPKDLNIKLIIVGGVGYSTNNNSKYIMELKKITKEVSDKVIFTGYIDYEEMPEIYAIADVGVIPSLCNDAFNLTTVEFMSNHVPVIVSNMGGMKEIINDKCGIVVNYDENFVNELSVKLLELCTNDALRWKMGQEAYCRSQMFSKENYCKRFNDLLDNFEEENCGDK